MKLLELQGTVMYGHNVSSISENLEQGCATLSRALTSPIAPFDSDPLTHIVNIS